MSKQLDREDDPEVPSIALASLSKLMERGVGLFTMPWAENPLFKGQIIALNGTERIKKFQKRGKYSKEAQRSAIQLIKAFFDLYHSLRALGLPLTKTD